MTESVVDTYLTSVGILKNKVANVLRQYNTLLHEKIQCDVGNSISYDPASFHIVMADVLAHLAEVETKLNGLEAWVNLPTECFHSTVVGATTAGGNSDFEIDAVCHEAQSLVDVVSQMQASLRSMVSEPTLRRIADGKRAVYSAVDQLIVPDQGCTKPIHVCGIEQTMQSTTDKHESEQSAFTPPERSTTSSTINRGLSGPPDFMSTVRQNGRAATAPAVVLGAAKSPADGLQSSGAAIQSINSVPSLQPLHSDIPPPQLPLQSKHASCFASGLVQSHSVPPFSTSGGSLFAGGCMGPEGVFSPQQSTVVTGLPPYTPPTPTAIPAASLINVASSQATAPVCQVTRGGSVPLASGLVVGPSTTVGGGGSTFIAGGPIRQLPTFPASIAKFGQTYSGPTTQQEFLPVEGGGTQHFTQ